GGGMENSEGDPRPEEVPVRDHPALEVVLGGIAPQLIVLREQDIREPDPDSEADRPSEQPPLGRGQPPQAGRRPRGHRSEPTIDFGRSVHPSARFNPADQSSTPGEINTVRWY